MPQKRHPGFFIVIDIGGVVQVRIIYSKSSVIRYCKDLRNQECRYSIGIIMNQTSRTKATNKYKPDGEQHLSDYLAIMPGLLMCLMVLMMVVMDVTVPEMSAKQYDDFPVLFRVLNYSAVICGAGYLAVLAYKKAIHFTLTHALFASFLLCIAISTAVNGLGDEAIHGLPYRNIGILHMVAFIIIYMGASSLINRNAFIEFIMLLYIAIADFIGLAVLFDRYIGHIPAFHEKKDISAIFFNGNHYGYFLVMAVMIGLGYFMLSNGVKMTAGGISAVLNALLLILNHSTGCILAASAVSVAACLFVILKDKGHRQKAWIVLGALILGIVAAYIASPDIRKELEAFSEDLVAVMSNSASGSAGHNRMKVWMLTAKYIAERPLFGHGCEGISLRLFSETAISNPHNEILTYAAYYGIPAAAVYVLGVLSVVTTCIKRHSDKRISKEPSTMIACMAATGYFISSITGVAMFYTAPFFFIFLGLACDDRTEPVK